MPTEWKQTSTIIIEIRASGMHSWPDATGINTFLSHPHHHIFTASIELEVLDTNREIEFIAAARRFEAIFQNELSKPRSELATFSCEQMAIWLAERVLYHYGTECDIKVTVREDGIHGGTYERKKK